MAESQVKSVEGKFFSANMFEMTIFGTKLLIKENNRWAIQAGKDVQVEIATPATWAWIHRLLDGLGPQFAELKVLIVGEYDFSALVLSGHISLEQLETAKVDERAPSLTVPDVKIGDWQIAISVQPIAQIKQQWGQKTRFVPLSGGDHPHPLVV